MKSAQKPQDIVILLKVHCLDSMWTYDDLAKSLKTSASVVYEALQRCEQCRLYNSKRRKVLKSAVEEYHTWFKIRFSGLSWGCGKGCTHGSFCGTFEGVVDDG